jgi:hypothetical protein
MQHLNSCGFVLAVAGMNPVIFRIFRDLGFEPLIPHFLTVKQAKEQLTVPVRGEHGGDERERGR